MIHPYNHANLNRWISGELQVQLEVPGQARPMGWCDGSSEDERELLAMAEEEGVEGLTIRRKLLKTGRQIWTLGDPPMDVELDED